MTTQLLAPHARPLGPVHPVIFIDAIHVKMRDRQRGQPTHLRRAGRDVDGERDIPGLWAGDGGEGAKYWLHVLIESKNRGVADCCIVVCDGLLGLPDAISTVWPAAAGVDVGLVQQIGATSPPPASSAGSWRWVKRRLVTPQTRRSCEAHRQRGGCGPSGSWRGVGPHPRSVSRPWCRSRPRR